MIPRNELFKSKLSDELKHECCLRIAVGFSARMLQIYLAREHGIQMTYGGLRKLWRRRRWVRLTAQLRASIASRPEIKKWILDIISEELSKLREDFKSNANELLTELKAARNANPPNLVNQFNILGIALGESFNRALEKAAVFSERLRNVTGAECPNGSHFSHLCEREKQKGVINCG